LAVVDETKTRSLAKTVTSRIVEVIVDTAVIASFLSALAGWGGGWEKYVVVAILVESICAASSYLNERLWNRIQWGRRIKRRGQKHP
jgi:uncharacterized membrane protein